MNLKKRLRLFYVCVFLASVHAVAQEKPRAPVTVWTSGTVDSAKAVFGPKAKVDILSREREERAERRAGHLPPPERDALFRRIGIETKISGMDEFDRDMLMLGAGAYTIPELKSDYPMLSEKELTALKREMVKVK